MLLTPRQAVKWIFPFTEMPKEPTQANSASPPRHIPKLTRGRFLFSRFQSVTRDSSSHSRSASGFPRLHSLPLTRSLTTNCYPLPCKFATRPARRPVTGRSSVTCMTAQTSSEESKRLCPHLPKITRNQRIHRKVHHLR